MISVSKQGARAQMQGVRAATEQLQQRLAMAGEVAKASEQRLAVNETRGFDEVAVSRAAASEAFWARHWGLSSEFIGHSNQLQGSMARRRKRDSEARAKVLLALQESRENDALRRRNIALQARQARAKEFFDSRKGAGKMAELREHAQLIRETHASLAAQEMAEDKLGRNGGVLGRHSYSVAKQSLGTSGMALSSAAMASTGVGAAMGVVEKAGRLNSVGTRRAADAATGGGGVLAHGPRALQEDGREGEGYGTVAQDQLERDKRRDVAKRQGPMPRAARPNSFDAGVSMGGFQFAGALDPYQSEPRARARTRSTGNSTGGQTGAANGGGVGSGASLSEASAHAGCHEEEYLLGLARKRFAHSGRRLAAPDTAFSRPDKPDPSASALAELHQAVAEAEGKRELRRQMSRKLTSDEASHAQELPAHSHGSLGDAAPQFEGSNTLETVVEGSSGASGDAELGT